MGTSSCTCMQYYLFYDIGAIVMCYFNENIEVITYLCMDIFEYSCLWDWCLVWLTENKEFSWQGDLKFTHDHS